MLSKQRNLSFVAHVYSKMASTLLPKHFMTVIHSEIWFYCLREQKKTNEKIGKMQMKAKKYLFCILQRNTMKPKNKTSEVGQNLLSFAQNKKVLALFKQSSVLRYSPTVFTFTFAYFELKKWFLDRICKSAFAFLNFFFS